MLKPTLHFLLAFSISMSSYAEEKNLPAQFGLGQKANEAEIKKWDSDITPDGKQLPPGKGNVTSGARIYENKCLACHGESGRDGINDQLVARFDPDINFSKDPALKRTIGNYWPYATTLYDYISRAMPQATPGSLSANEVYSLVAYLLFLNNIVKEDVILDAGKLAAIKMPARHLFYWSEEARSAARP